MSANEKPLCINFNSEFMTLHVFPQIIAYCKILFHSFTFCSSSVLEDIQPFHCVLCELLTAVLTAVGALLQKLCLCKDWANKHSLCFLTSHPYTAIHYQSLILLSYILYLSLTYLLWSFGTFVNH